MTVARSVRFSASSAAKVGGGAVAVGVRVGTSVRLGTIVGSAVGTAVGMSVNVESGTALVACATKVDGTCADGLTVGVARPAANTFIRVRTPTPNMTSAKPITPASAKAGILPTRAPIQGGMGARADDARKTCPQWAQKCASIRFGLWQFGQVFCVARIGAARLVRQLAQKRAPARFSVPHLGQRIECALMLSFCGGTGVLCAEHLYFHYREIAAQKARFLPRAPESLGNLRS